VGRYPVGYGVSARVGATPSGPRVLVAPGQWTGVSLRTGVPLPPSLRAQTESSYVPVADGSGQVTFDFDHIPLLDGTYLVTLAIQSSDEGTVHDWRDQQYQFEVMNPSRVAGLVALPLQMRFGTPFAQRVEGTGT